MVLTEHLAKCESAGIDYNTPWYKWVIERLQHIFLQVGRTADTCIQCMLLTRCVPDPSQIHTATLTCMHARTHTPCTHTHCAQFIDDHWRRRLAGQQKENTSDPSSLFFSFGVF